MGRLKAFGIGEGAWKVPEGYLSSDSVCYSAGAGEDITFDVAIAHQFGCDVHLFDPTPRAIAHFHNLREHALSGESMLVGGTSHTYPVDTHTLDRLHFHPFGVYGSEKTLRFYAPKNPSHVSHSVRNLQDTERFFEAKCKTIQSFMQQFGHDRLDLLKLDIEGAEHSVIDHLIADGVRPRILCIEFDSALQQRRYAEAAMDLNRLVKFGYDLAEIRSWNATLLARESAPRFSTRLKMLRLNWQVRRKNRRAARKAA